MQKLVVHQTKDILKAIGSYPIDIQNKPLYLRQVIFGSAEKEGITNLEETLKWGEPNYLAKNGSTLRMDWKSKTPNHFALYFKCTSQLIPTIRTIFGPLFSYEKNRAIIFKLEDNIPRKELKVCIKMALKYHKLKHLPYLGASSN